MASTMLGKYGKLNLRWSQLKETFSTCSRLNQSNNKTVSGSTEETSNSKSNNLKLLLDNTSPLKLSDAENYEWATEPYPEGTVFDKCDQAQHSLRPKCDPRTTSILQFPGQGSQFVGMGKDLLRYPVVADMFASASSILGYDLLKVCLNGPQQLLNRTEYSQPAIVVCSLAAIEKLKDENPDAVTNCIATAGFSVGEISALIFAGAFSFERGMKLVKVRAEAMQLASEMVPSGMITVLYGPDSKVGQACEDAKQHCKQQGVDPAECVVANYLFPHCKVVAGNQEALQFIMDNQKKYKLRRVQKIDVTGAFHTSLMRPAVEPFRKALQKAIITDPIISVHSNVDGKRYKNAEDIYHKLCKQIYSPVRWEQILHILYTRDPEQGFPQTYECGPGKSLHAILKQVNRKAADYCKSIS